MSSWYPFILFIHIFSAFLLFALWFLELMLVTGGGAGRLPLQPVMRYTGSFQRVCMVLVFLSGFYQMHGSWGPQPWLVTSVILLLLTIPVSVALSRITRTRGVLWSAEKTNFILLSNSIYKVGTALVILVLMVFKNASYDQSLLIVTVSYFFIFGLTFRLYWQSKTTG